MRFSIQWWGFSSGWRRPGHSPLCVIRAGATLTVLICRGSTRRRRGLRFLLKVCNNDCQISNGNFQMLSTTPIHIFQSWPGFLMTVLFASCFLFTFFFFYFIFFLFLWLCRGYKLLSNLLCNQLGDRSRFPVTWVILLGLFPHRSTSPALLSSMGIFLTGIHWNFLKLEISTVPWSTRHSQ